MAAPRVPPTHEVIIVPPPGHEDRDALLQQCIQVRIDVFVTEQGFPLEVEVDEYVNLLDNLSTCFKSLMKQTRSKCGSLVIKTCAISQAHRDNPCLQSGLRRQFVLQTYTPRRSEGIPAL